MELRSFGALIPRNSMSGEMLTAKPMLDQRGQVLMVVVILFTTLLTIVVVGLVAPIMTQLQLARTAQNSKQSYYATESLAEDMAYRLRTGKEVSANETLTVAGAEVEASVTSEGGTQHITAYGDNQDLVRAVHIQLSQGEGFAFNYGTQTGNGGFVISNNAGVYGNVYSNGDIIGANAAFITGTAVAASSIAQTADQVNDAPTTPPNDISFGNANGTQDVTQSFIVSTAAPANSVSFFIRKVGTPSNATIRITTDNGGLPADSELGTATLNAAQVTSSFGWVTVVFPPGISLIPETTYWIVMDASTNGNNYYSLAANINTYGNGVAKVGRYGTSWGDTSPSGLDGYFKFYIGGQSATISTLVIGEYGEGDAWAHVVSNSTIEGTNYCETGSGNNKGCDTSREDPPPQPFPISDGNIDEWKAAAAGGTVLVGDRTISDPTSLGPGEITGNLTIDSTLTLTGVVYVHGNVYLGNNNQVRLDTAFGSTGTVLLVDGWVQIENGGNFSTTGFEGSYILLLTTSTCYGVVVGNCSSTSAGYAVQVENNAGTVIINAQKGAVKVSNNAGAKEITADRIVLENNATVTYESGLANTVFTTGPSGGYTISAWEEVE